MKTSITATSEDKLFDIVIKGTMYSLLATLNAIVKAIAIRMYDELDCYEQYITVSENDTYEDIISKLQTFIIAYLYENNESMTTLAHEHISENSKQEDSDGFNINQFEQLF